MEASAIANLILVMLCGLISGTIIAGMSESIKQLKRIATALEVLAVMKHAELEDDKNERNIQPR